MEWRAWKAPLLVAAVGLSFVALSWTSLVEKAELWSYDHRLALREPTPWPNDLVLVPVDDAALEIHGRWPWKRSLIGSLLERVRAAGARTIVFDFEVAAATDAEEDAALAAALEGVILPVGGPLRGVRVGESPSLEQWLLPVATRHGLPATELKLPLPSFRARAGGLGHALQRRDPDESIRRHLPFLEVEETGQALPSLALVAWSRQRGWDLGQVRSSDGSLVLPDGRRIALDDDRFPLDLSGRDPAIASVSAGDVLDPSKEPDVRSRIDGRIALLYSEMSTSGDHFRTSFDERLPGGILHALAIRSLATGRVPRVFSPTWPMALLIALASAASAHVARRSPTFALLASAVAAVAWLAGSAVLVRAADVFLPTIAPIAFLLATGPVLAASGAFSLEQEHRRLKDLLEAARAPLAERTHAGGAPDPILSLVGGVELEHPVQFGRYEIQRTIGRGGMGAIFLARDLELDRMVAIKVLEAAAPDSFARFRREAMAIAKIDHPNVVHVYELGMDARVPYIVMEHVAGGPLSRLLEHAPGGVSPDRAARLVMGVARGLGAAHAGGVVHRDVKPANLLLVHPDSDAVKVVDFGIAKLGGADALTHAGSMIGTIGYLAPEQAAGSEVDARADVFALGVTWFRIVTGRMPFEGSIPEVLRATVERRVPDPRGIRAELPESHASLLLAMTDPDPARRPGNGSDTAERIAALLA